MKLLKENRVKVLLFLGLIILIGILPNKVFAATEYNHLTYDNFKYIIEENGEATITWGDEDATSINIPEQINGHKVTKIGHQEDLHGALSGLTKVTSITIPNSVTEIGVDIFTGNTSLEELVIPDSVIKIGSSFATGCTSLKKVTFSSNVQSLGFHTLEGCTALEEITIPNSVTEIGYYAFYGCTSLKSVTIPKSVAEIAEGAFSKCGDVKFNVYKDSTAHAWAITNNYPYELIDGMSEVTLTDSRSKISILLIAESTAELKVEQILEKTDEYNELLAKLSNATAVSAYDISVISGKYEGKINITFTVNEIYEGKEITVLHKKANGEIEQFKQTVKDSKITITTSELSPFMLAVSSEEETTNNNEQNETTSTNNNETLATNNNLNETKTINNNELDDTPKTGVMSYIPAIIVSTLACVIGFAFVMKKD